MPPCWKPTADSKNSPDRTSEFTDDHGRLSCSASRSVPETSRLGPATPLKTSAPAFVLETPLNKSAQLYNPCHRKGLACVFNYLQAFVRGLPQVVDASVWQLNDEYHLVATIDPNTKTWVRADIRSSVQAAVLSACEASMAVYVYQCFRNPFEELGHQSFSATLCLVTLGDAQHVCWEAMCYGRSCRGPWCHWLHPHDLE